MPQPSHQTQANFEVKSGLSGDGEVDGPGLEQEKRENEEGGTYTNLEPRSDLRESRPARAYLRSPRAGAKEYPLDLYLHMVKLHLERARPMEKGT